MLKVKYIQSYHIQRYTKLSQNWWNSIEIIITFYRVITLANLANYLILASCKQSLDCGDSEFCNFDFDNHGYCEACLPLAAGGTCSSLGLIMKKGEEECSKICGGKSIDIPNRRTQTIQHIIIFCYNITEDGNIHILFW